MVNLLDNALAFDTFIYITPRLVWPFKQISGKRMSVILNACVAVDRKYMSGNEILAREFFFGTTNDCR